MASRAEDLEAERGSILVLCPFPEGVAAGQRLKYEQYLDDWRAMGFSVEVRPFMDQALWDVAHREGHLVRKVLGTLRGLARRRRQMRDVRSFDLVYLFMWATPVGNSSAERRLRKAAKRLIYDIEDNILEPASAAGQLASNPLLRWIRGSDKAHLLVRTADHVIASSPALADRCREINQRGAATYITSSVDTDRFLPANDYSNDDPVVVGWTGTISTRPFLHSLKNIFQELARKRKFRLRVIGNFDYDLPGVDLEVIRWNSRDEARQMQGIDIGIYPLPRDQWVHGKSGLKAIQYMAFGLPCVATRAGHTPDVVTDGATGILVESEQEWLDALLRLIDDPGLRRKMGEAAREEAVRRFSLRTVAAHYRRVIGDVMQLPASEGVRRLNDGRA